jgi:predicted transposase YbfD/YdcC
MPATSPASPRQPVDVSVTKYFAGLKDPRRRHRRLHQLQDVIVIALCAVIAGAQDWQDIETFGRRRRAWLERFLELPHGIPSHDTFERVFDRLNPQAFQACFRDWAWATAQHLSLGQVAVQSKSNEITAIPALLELLDLEGALVTIDAMGCQKAIARKIVERGGAYALTVKDNQPHLLQDIQRCLERAFDSDYAGLEHDSWEKRERGHGREEFRCYTVLHTTEGIRHVEEWAGLTTIGMCYSERTVRGKTTTEVRYFIGSKKASARYYGRGLRRHWGIENNLHWQLDVNFGEDRNRVSKRHGAENLALLRRLTLTLLLAHPESLSIAKKRFAAALDTGFLEEILAGDGILEKR